MPDKKVKTPKPEEIERLAREIWCGDHTIRYVVRDGRVVQQITTTEQKENY